MEPAQEYTPDGLEERMRGLDDLHASLYETVMGLRELAGRIREPSADCPLDQTAVYNIGTNLTSLADKLTQIDAFLEAQRRNLSSLLGWGNVVDGVNPPLAQRVYPLAGKRLDALYEQRAALSSLVDQLTTRGEEIVSLLTDPLEGQRQERYAALLENMAQNERAASSLAELFEMETKYLQGVMSHIHVLQERDDHPPETDHGSLMKEAAGEITSLRGELESARDLAGRAAEEIASIRAQYETAEAARSAAEGRAEGAEAALHTAETNVRESAAEATDARESYASADADRTAANARVSELERLLAAAEGRVNELDGRTAEAERLYQDTAAECTGLRTRVETAERFSRDTATEFEGLRQEASLNADTITAIQGERVELQARADAAEREAERYRTLEQDTTRFTEEIDHLRSEIATRDDELHAAYGEQRRIRRDYETQIGQLTSDLAVAEARERDLIADRDGYRFRYEDREIALQQLRERLRTAGASLAGVLQKGKTTS